MNKTLLPIRLIFIALCVATGYLVCYTVEEWDGYRSRAAIIGLCIGLLVVLVDIMLKGFSLRGLSAITFGLLVGVLNAHLISTSPLFAKARSDDSPIFFLIQLALFIIITYLCTVIALRGKD